MKRVWRLVMIVTSCLAAYLTAVGFIDFLSGRDLVFESAATALETEVTAKTETTAVLPLAGAANVGPGIPDAIVHSARVRLPNENTEVIGVEVDGHARAYIIKLMGFTPSRHIVNDLIEGVPVTATYCVLCDFARVFTKSGHSGKALDVDLDGVLHEGKMMLLVDGGGFLCDAADVPLDDMPFERMSWKAWKTKHPDTDIYVGAWRPGENDPGEDEMPAD
jgi:hypothetical protein